MSDALLYLWDLSIAASMFGWGRFGLRLCRIQKPSANVSGIFGVCLWIACGAWLNLLHQLRPGVFFAMDGLGLILLAIDFFVSRRTAGHEQQAEADPRQSYGLTARLLLGAGVLSVTLLAIDGMHPLRWNVDDLQGYAALAVKTAQTHAIQPDPFSERHIQAGVGGATFLDAAMYAEDDMRAMPFIDSAFGLCLYALGLWALGRKWKAPPLALALAMLWLVFASLLKGNLTIIHLSAAAFFAVLILLSDSLPNGHIPWGRAIAIGIIVGSIASTKSPNITFLVPFLAMAAVFKKLLEPKARIIAPTLLSFLTAVIVFLPWAVANKATSGTYLYPLLGLGDHASAYHFIPVPSKMAPLQLTFVLAIPDMALIGLALIFIWHVSGSWKPGPRAALIAYLLASALALPVIAYGVGGEAFDRYSAPILVPALLISVLIFCMSWKVATRPWRSFGIITQIIATIYVLVLIDMPTGEHTRLLAAASDVFNLRKEPLPPWVMTYTGPQLKDKFALGAKIQASIPPGETALAVMEPEFLFDFRRNTIYIADWPGMASPYPGLPLEGTPEQQRQFLVHAGVHYLIESADYPHDTIEWHTFQQLQYRQYPWYFFIIHQRWAHQFHVWMFTELLVTNHERDVFRQILQASPVVYNDGRVAVARID